MEILYAIKLHGHIIEKHVAENITVRQCLKQMASKIDVGKLNLPLSLGKWNYNLD